MINVLLNEFNKQNLASIDLYSILASYLKDEMDYCKNNKKNFNYFNNSNFLSFFDNKNNFNKKYNLIEKEFSNSLSDSDSFKELYLYLENKSELESILIEQFTKKRDRDSITLIYKKIINSYEFKKTFYIYRNGCESNSINLLNVYLTVYNYSISSEYLCNFEFNHKLLNTTNFYSGYAFGGLCLDILKQTENSILEEDFFNMMDIKYDFSDNTLKNILLHFFSINHKFKIDELIDNYNKLKL